MDKDIEILQDWIARDREMRNNSTQSDYDKFCEEKCEAIEHIIIENIQFGEQNKKLELALIDSDRELQEYKKAYELACREISILEELRYRKVIPRNTQEALEKEFLEEAKKVMNDAPTDKNL